MSHEFVTRCWQCRSASLCIDCGAWGIFTPKEPDGLRQPTPAEDRQLKANPVCQMVRAAWQARARPPH